MIDQITVFLENSEGRLEALCALAEPPAFAAMAPMGSPAPMAV